MPALEINQLTKTYANGFSALKGINLTVKSGDFFALLGSNGAGKSTTIGIITSLVNKSSGQVKIFGHDLDTQPGLAKTYVGLVPQEFNFNIFEPIIEILINQAGYYGIPREEATERAEKYLKLLNLWQFRRTIGKNLSGGMKRRLMIARALIHHPKLLILDEPTAGVDVEIRHSMWHFLRKINKEGITIILTTHYIEEAEELCDQIAIIKEGEIIENTSMKELLSRIKKETLVFEIKDHSTGIPPHIEEYQLNLVNTNVLEIEITKNQSINHLINTLCQHKIEIISMRNKNNRLEQLFIDLVKSNTPYMGKL
jgi:ABC-2 type transport system ATP-binding protein